MGVDYSPDVEPIAAITERSRRAGVDPSKHAETVPVTLDLHPYGCPTGWTLTTEAWDQALDVGYKHRIRVPRVIRLPLGSSWMIIVPSVQWLDSLADEQLTFGPFALGEEPARISGTCGAARVLPGASSSRRDPGVTSRPALQAGYVPDRTPAPE